MVSISQPKRKKQLQQEELNFLALYGLLSEQREEGVPLFGPGHWMDLGTQPDMDENGLSLPTLTPLARWAGDMPAYTEKERAMLLRTDPYLIGDRERQGTNRFYRRIILPMRQYLTSEMDMNLYALSAQEIVKNPRTGRLSIQTGGVRGEENPFLLIPHSVQQAQLSGLHENAIILIAPYAIRVLNNQIGRGQVREEKALAYKVDSWFEIAPGLKHLTWAKVKEKAPCIAARQGVKQLRLHM